MNSRSIMICLTATGISSLLLFFYFKNKLSTVEEKLDSMFQLIQNYAAQSEKRSNEAQWRVQNSTISTSVDAVQETSYVNNSKIVVLIMIAKKKAKVKVKVKKKVKKKKKKK